MLRNKRAVGVQYVSDVVGRNGGITTLLTARASRLVVVSSGAFGSPAILERSGIGGKSVLEKAGVEVLVDLPGVGEHYLGTCHLIRGRKIFYLFCVMHRSLWDILTIRSDPGCGHTRSNLSWKRRRNKLYDISSHPFANLHLIPFYLVHAQQWLNDGKGLMTHK